jgi:hypothetical protein
MLREALRWEFVAEYANGDLILQEDDSCLTREDGTGSRFTDVLANPEKLVSFHLANNATDEVVSVDLLTGAFVVNGTPVHIHEQNFEPIEHELSLVYFRETRIEQMNNAKEEVIGERHFTNRYFIGWTAEVNGTTKQATLAVG